MSKRVRVLVVALVSATALTAAASATAAFRPAIAVGTQPPTLQGTTTQIRVTVPREDDALFRATIFAPTGYSIRALSAAPGTMLGTVTAQVEVREPIAGAVLPLQGQVVQSVPETYAAQAAACVPGATVTTVWELILQASGQTLRVPVFVQPIQTGHPLATLVSYRLDICLPSPHIPASAGGATFGAKLINAQMNLRDVFTVPAQRGAYRWRLAATPWPNGPGLPNAAGTVTAQGRVMLPAAIAIRTSSARRVLTIRGSVTEAGEPVRRQRIRVRVGNRNYNVTTTTGGAYTLRVRVPGRAARTTVTVTAAIPARTIPCTDFPAIISGATCVSETLQFWTMSRSVRPRVR